MQNTKVHYFNPTCELAVANGSFSYMPPILLQEMERDLSILPFVFGTISDIVLTENPPTEKFKNFLTGFGFELPSFCRISDFNATFSDTIDELCPWGWSPAVHFKLKELKERCTASFKQSPIYNWNENHQLLYERSSALNLLSDILKHWASNYFIDQSMKGIIVTNSNEIEAFQKKHKTIVLKAPMSSSGRGIQIIRNQHLNTSNRQWISGVLKQQKYLIIEPFLEKTIDLSFQFQIQDDFHINYLGNSFFETSTTGQYKGTLIHPELNQLLPNEDPLKINEIIQITANAICQALKDSIYAKHYRGLLGIDAILFNSSGQTLIQPCIEVNCRRNMGILTMLLEDGIHSDAKGKFQLFYGSTGEYLKFSEEQLKLNPPKQIEGKFHSGFLPLVEPDLFKKFGAYINCDCR